VSSQVNFNFDVKKFLEKRYDLHKVMPPALILMPRIEYSLNFLSIDLQSVILAPIFKKQVAILAPL